MNYVLCKLSESSFFFTNDGDDLPILIMKCLVSL